MMEYDRIFTIAVYNNRGCFRSAYALYADPWTTLDTAWASQKCWFMPGTIVKITDDQGNSKTFIKE